MNGDGRTEASPHFMFFLQAAQSSFNRISAAEEAFCTSCRLPITD
jgi:hypothetical protein